MSLADNLTANDTNDYQDVFVRDLQIGTNILVSVNNSGGGSANGFSSRPVMSANGRYVGFVSNALRARPKEVTVTVSDETDDKGVPLIWIVADDDGGGGAPSAFARGSGLANLDELCRLRGGAVHLSSRENGGTRATACFTYPYQPARRAGNNTGQSFMEEELADG